jgi:hypothetical protein
LDDQQVSPDTREPVRHAGSFFCLCYVHFDFFSPFNRQN